MPQKRTARKQTGASAGSAAAAAHPVSAAPAPPAAPAHQQNQSSSVVLGQGLLSVQSRNAPAAQRPGTGGATSACGQQQPAPFDLSAAMRGRQPAQAPANSTRPDQAPHSPPTVPVPTERRSPETSGRSAAAAQRLPGAQAHKVVGQPTSAGATVQAQAAGRSEQSGQTSGALGKRAMQPGSEPPAKRAKQSDGSLLSLAERVMIDIARERHGRAGGHSRVRFPGRLS